MFDVMSRIGDMGGLDRDLVLGIMLLIAFVGGWAVRDTRKWRRERRANRRMQWARAADYRDSRKRAERERAAKAAVTPEP